MLITRKSPVSGNTHTVDLDLDEAQLLAYYRGELIQIAMPNLSAGEREFFKTGVTEEEWIEMFGGEE